MVMLRPANDQVTSVDNESASEDPETQANKIPIRIGSFNFIALLYLLGSWIMGTNCPIRLVETSSKATASFQCWKRCGTPNDYKDPK